MNDVFRCPNCGNELGKLDEDVDEPGMFVCDKCDWEGPADEGIPL